MGWEFWQNLGAAALCGAIIGLERQLDGKPMGLRTGILIAAGTATFVLLGDTVDERGDSTRVLGQLITGVGFLGGGVLFQQNGVVQGLTTAAAVWLLAAIGAAAGMGYGLDAVLLSVAAVVALRGLGSLERALPGLRKGAHGIEKP